MDNAKVEVRETGKYGLGLYANEPIRKGEVIADWSGGRIYTAERATELPNEPPYFVQDHAIQFSQTQYIDYDGIGRLFSHSCEPSCGFQGKFTVVAMRDIAAGEELSFDYAMSEDSDWRLDCQCGSNECRGVVGATSIVPRERLEEYGHYLSEWIRKEYGIAPQA